MFPGSCGTVRLEESQAHHARHVLRLPDGSAIEVFDNAGNTAAGTLVYPDDSAAAVAVESVRPGRVEGVRLTVASAVPKAERADWLVEKLSELGVIRWIPLAAERSVAVQAGPESGNDGCGSPPNRPNNPGGSALWTIEELTPLPTAIATTGARSPGCNPGAGPWVLSTAVDETDDEGTNVSSPGGSHGIYRPRGRMDRCGASAIRRSRYRRGAIGTDDPPYRNRRHGRRRDRRDNARVRRARRKKGIAVAGPFIPFLPFVPFPPCVG